MAWWEKWGPYVTKDIQIIGIIAAVGVLLYYLFWIALFGVALAAADAGMSEGGSEGVARANHYNQLRRDRPTNNPKYWKR